MLSEEEKRRRLALLQQQTRPLAPLQSSLQLLQQTAPRGTTMPTVMVGQTKVSVKPPQAAPQPQPVARPTVRIAAPKPTPLPSPFATQQVVANIPTPKPITTPGQQPFAGAAGVFNVQPTIEKRNYLQQVTQMASQGKLPKYIEGGGKPTAPYALGSPEMQFTQMKGISKAEFEAAQQAGVKQAIQKSYEQKYGTPGERAQKQIEQALGPVAGPIATGLAQFTPIRIAQYAIATPQRIINTLTGQTGAKKNEGVLATLYGEEPVGSYTQLSDSIYNWMNQSDNSTLKVLAPLAPAIAPALAALDITSFGFVKKLFGRSAEAQLKKTAEDQLKRSLTPEESQALTNMAKSQEVRTLVKDAKEAPGRPVTGPTITAPVPAAGTRTLVSDQVVNRLISQRNAAQIEAAVKNIYPNGSPSVLNTAISEIQKAQNPEQVRTILDSLSEAKAATEAVTPAGIAPQAVAREQAFAAETQRPTGAVAAPKAPEAPIAPTTVPEGVQGAQAPTAVPEAIKPQDMATQVTKSAEAELGKYKGETVWRKIKNIWDQRSLAVEADRLAKKYYEAEGKQFTTNKSLYQAIGQVPNFEIQAQRFVKDGPLKALFTKYGNDPEFNVYRIYKRNVESVDNGGKEFLIPLTDQPGRLASLDEQRAFIQWYENKNPQAINDLRTMSKEINKLQDQATVGDMKVLNAQELTDLRVHPNGNPIEFYTPIQRVQPEELLRATIGGQNVGSVARQTLLRDMQYGARQAIDNSLWSVYDYIRNAKLLENRIRVNRLITEGVQKGYIKGLNILYTGEQVGKLATKKLELAQARKEIKSLGTKFKVTKRQERRLASEMNQLQRAGMQEAVKTAGKPGIKLTPTGKMPSTKKIFDSLIKIDSPTLVRLKNKIATREPILASKLDEVIVAKANLEQAQSIKQQLKQEVIDITPDPTTGLQTINGIDEYGRAFKIEITPEWAKLIQGFDKLQLNKGYKAARTVSDIFKAPIIALNPSFQLIMTGMNVAMAPLYSKLGFRLWNPKYLSTFVKSFSDTNDIVAKAQRMGAPSFNGNLSQIAGNTFVDQLASQYNALSRVKWYNPVSKRGALRGYDKVMEQTGKLDRAIRAVAFEAAYKRAKNLKFTEEQAMAAGLEAWNTAQPDFSNVAPAIKALDLAIWFLAPTQASLRGLGRTFRENPASFLGKAAVISAPMLLVTAYNLMMNEDPQLKEFYKDMKDSNREYVTSNNIIYTIPGVKVEKDTKTGEWKGIFKIPLAPELRPLQQGFVEGIKNIADGNGLPPEIVAKAIFNTVTGKVWDVSNPMYNLAQVTINGKDPRTGAEVWVDGMTDDQKREAILRYWSKNAGPLGQVIGTFMPELPSEKGKATPNAFEVFIQSFTNRFKGAYGASEAGIHYQSVNDAIKKVGLNQNELATYNSTFMSKSTDALGNDIKNKKYTDSIKKAIDQLDPNEPSGLSKLWRVNVEANKEKVARGLPSNPLYELGDKEAQVVLTVQRLADNDARAKVLVDQNPWIKDYYKKQSDYWDKVMSTMTDEQRQKAGIDSMGIERPVASKDLQTKLDQLNNLKTSAEKSQFYSDNPDVLDFFSKQEEYQRFKDAKQGLPLLDKYPTPTPEVKAMMDEYNTLPKQNGPLKKDGTPSSPDRSAWIRNNPQKWAIITDQWNKQTLYQLTKEAAMAQYEGVDISQKTLDKLNMNKQQYQAWFAWPYVKRQYLTQLLSNVSPVGLPEAPKLKAVPKIKTKKPSYPRRTKKIKLQ